MDKQLVEKANRAKTGPSRRQGYNACPAQRLISRKTKTLLAKHNSLLLSGVANRTCSKRQPTQTGQLQ